MTIYPPETLHEEYDDGTIVENVETLASHVVGHRIVDVSASKVKRPYCAEHTSLTITLDNGKQVQLVGTDDCCAYTDLDEFLLNVDKIDHVITGVGTTDGYTTWHIFADFGDVMQLKVGWSCGNPFYYGYGFDITVQDVES